MADTAPASKKLKPNESNLRSNDHQNDRTKNVDLLKEANEALQESNRLHVRPIVDESMLGIELFIGDKKDEFHGLIKTRYADFIVHEIDPGGKVAELTTLEPPEETEVVKSLTLNDFVDSKALESISDVNNGYLNQYKIDVSSMDKEMRTSLHHAIRAAFDKLESSTTGEFEASPADKNGNPDDDGVKSEIAQQVESNQGEEASNINGAKQESIQKPQEKKFIVVTKRNKISRPKNVWPRDRPDHTHFILYKENKDTMDAVHNLAASISARPSNFSYAGVKDRRAVTTQWLSSWRLEPKRLISASRRFNKRPFIKVGNFCFKKEPIKLGQLQANKFDIVIRHLVYNDEGSTVVEKAMNSIKYKGFVNYFGLQRFGTRSIQTHEIGHAILEAKWEKAVDLILSYRFDDNMQPLVSQERINDNMTSDSEDSSRFTESQKIKQPKSDGKRWSNGAEQHNSFIDLWKSKLDAEIVFKKYPHFRFSNEGLIMKSLSKSEDSSRDFLNALVSLPRNVRSMYVHSYQSLLWNKATTYRLKTYGFEVVPGDLILSLDANVSDNSLDVLLSADEVDVHDESGDNNNFESNLNQRRKAPIEEIDSKIVIATEENLKDYTIFDVVLPIVGSRVRLPLNSVGAEFERLLKKDNLTLDSFKTKEKLFISYGSYRKVMVRPSNVNWTVKQYSHPQQNLVETDLDKLNRELMTKDKESGVDKLVPPPKSDSSDEALIVSFELPPSSYATMCLREIMKKSSTDFNNRF